MTRFWLLVLAAGAAGCAGPTAPAGDPPAPLSATTYSLTISADSLTCRDLTQPRAVMPIYAWVSFTLDGNVWVGRPWSAASGDFEIRLRRAGNPTLRDTPVSGTWKGTARDTGVAPVLPPNGVSVLAPPGEVTIEGLADNQGRLAQGGFTAGMTFSNGARDVTCPSDGLRWGLIRNPAPPRN